MWYSIYQSSTGELLGGTELLSNIPDPMPEDREYRTDPERPDSLTHEWNSSQRKWVAKAPSRILTVQDFMKKLTLSERVAYYGSRGTGTLTVKDAITGVRDMGDGIDLDDPVTAQMLDLLVGDGADIPLGTADGRVDILADCFIESYKITVIGSGNITIDVWRSTTAAYPPVDGGSITGSTPPTLSSGNVVEVTNLADWGASRQLIKGDSLFFNIDACTGITYAQITLRTRITQ